jgi:antirestriction protein ArdC
MNAVILLMRAEAGLWRCALDDLRQASEIGGQVQRGQKSTLILYWWREQ